MGNLAPEGSVIKSTAIDPSVIDDDGIYRRGQLASSPANETRLQQLRVEEMTDDNIQASDIMVLAGRGPLTGMRHGGRRPTN